MPLIDFFEPSDEPESEPVQLQLNTHERIQKFLDVKNWKCLVCGSVVFGRCKTCPYCLHKNGMITNRPKEFGE